MPNSKLGVKIYIYVDPTTHQVDAMYSFSVFGAQLRDNGEWNYLDDSDLNDNMADLNGDYVYDLDWDVDSTPVSEAADDDDSEHPLIDLYDKNQITEDDVKKYAVLIKDPTQPAPEVTN